jgi:hypothetical protein
MAVIVWSTVGGGGAGEEGDLNSHVVETTRICIKFEMNFSRNGIIPGKNQISDRQIVFQRRVATSALSVSNVDGNVAHGQ